MSIRVIHMPQIPFEQLTGVGVAGLSVYFFYKLAVNHLSHNTKALEELVLVIRELREFLQNHIQLKL